MKVTINVPQEVRKLLLCETNMSQALWNSYLKVRGLRLVSRSEIVGTTEVTKQLLVRTDGTEFTQE